MKVVHLTSVHSPFDIRIFHKECQSLANEGLEVVLVAPHSHNEIVDGVRIHSVSRRNTRLKRITNTLYEVFKACRDEDAHVYHLHDPELLLVGLLLSFSGKRVVYDVHEDVPCQIYSKPYLPQILKPLISRLVSFSEKIFSRKLNAVCAATPHIRDRFLQYNDKVVDVKNYPLLDMLDVTESHWHKRKKQICYIGGISSARGIIPLVDAMENIDAELALLGNYIPITLRDELIKRPGWAKVNEYGFVGPQEVRNCLSSSKVGLATLLPTPSYIHSLPVKLFEYMAAGIPVVVSNFPLWKEIVEDNKCGICVDPHDSCAISDAVNKLLNDDKLAEEMGLNGRQAVIEKYNWKTEERKLLNLYESIY